jgi:protein Tex
VTNVAAFGAFVDVGVHQDGLVHVSAMSAGFVSDPRSVAKPGDVVRVKVLSVDTARNRISLTMRLDAGKEKERAGKAVGSPRGSRASSRTPGGSSPAQPSSAREVSDRGRGSPRTERDRRGSGDRRGGPRGDDRRTGQRADDRRGGSAAPAGGAMAEALRRAGLLDGSGAPATGKPGAGKPRGEGRP